MRKITKRSAAVIGATVVAIGGGAAWAATSWFEGEGTASASSSTVQKVTAVGTVSEKLYPGKSATAAVTATNPNDYPVSVTGTSDLKVAVTGAPGCAQKDADLSLSLPPANTIPAKSGATPGTLTGDWTNFVTMGKNADPACAGATFALTFKLEGKVA
ncbi:hypothetical protein [Actinoplanes sp. NPDC049599]|uniref:hypothetical protein n=1 Tax=Actinoplanes sp. NPDC049599 TaxID=3363903 RepID=UPI0037A30145